MKQVTGIILKYIYEQTINRQLSDDDDGDNDDGDGSDDNYYQDCDY